jgi:hypothetical protein
MYLPEDARDIKEHVVCAESKLRRGADASRLQAARAQVAAGVSVFSSKQYQLSWQCYNLYMYLDMPAPFCGLC